MRASDEDRERVARRLREHYGAGRLTDDELSERVEDVYTAQTTDALERLTADLPAEVPAAVPARRRKAELTRGGRALRASVKIHATIFLVVNLALVAIWALAGAGYFWPIWSIVGWGIGLGAHAAPVIAGVGRRHPSSADSVARAVERERPSLRAALAPDGTTTILFSDIEGSTALNERLGDHDWLELLRRHHAIVREQVAAHGGFEIKVQGDGFMLAFADARRAIGCARAIQEHLASRLDEIRVRIGLHTGEAIREQDDFYGKTVVLAARIAGAAAGGEILVSEAVRDRAPDLPLGEARELELAGLSGTYRAYPVN